MGDAVHAGIVRTADFLDMSDSDFDDVIDTNLKGVFIVSRSTQQQTTLLIGLKAGHHVELDASLSQPVPQSAAVMLSLKLVRYFAAVHLSQPVPQNAALML